ncbi:Ankyrin repeat-containing protein [Spatholobus suberectus]|nr:Ankyrin repeat-containing protein [Spatholobus suberectus]
MNMTSHDRLKGAAQDGDIDGLYTVIQEDPHVLERVDSIPFVDTPLHVAVSTGHLQFAIEIMTLKPSFAWKLNPQGFVPIHLALHLGHKRMVLRFVQINKDLIRAKGKKVRCGQYAALHMLVWWLMTTCQIGVTQLEETILNWKDEEGNTILHVSANENNLQMVQLLVKTKVDLKAKNFEERSALDIATNDEIRSILVGAKANSKITLMDRIISYLLRITSDITEDQRNAYLIIAALVTTATYQSVLSPPGGVYQANAGDNNANTNSLNSTATATQGNAGTSVLSVSSFKGVSLTNTLSFVVSIMAIVILTPPGIVGTILLSPIYLFAASYLLSLNVISPTKVVPPVAFAIIVPLLWLHTMTYLAYKRANKRCHGRYSAGENRW